jgi:HK97 family phage portal protein
MMGLLARIFRNETREAPRTVDPYFAEFTAIRSIGSATASNVLSCLAVAARCVALRSELLASVPLHLYRRLPNGGRERADDNPLYGVLHDIANDAQNAFEFRELMCRSLDLTGNFIARIERNARGQVTALWPILPADVSIDRLTNGRLRYRVFNGLRVEVLLQEEVLHVRGPSRDGVLGLSPVAIARGALSLALAHYDTADALSRNSLRPSGLISYDQQLRTEARKRVMDSYATEFGGASNAGKMLITDGGARYTPLSFSPEDAQFLQARAMSNEDVARVFGCPPTAVGILEKSTYSNTEQEARSLVQNTLGPLAGRIEAALHRCVLTDVGRRTLYVEHDLAGLLRGDVKARFDSYRLARECGVFSPNDVRQLENFPPIENGDVYNQPANWAPLGWSPPTSAPQGLGQ